MADGKDLLEKRQKLGELVEAQRALLGKATAEKRELTAEEDQTYTRMDAEVEALDKAIASAAQAEERNAKLAEREARLKARATEPIRPEPEPTKAEARGVLARIPAAVRARMPEHEIRRLEHRASPEYVAAFYNYLAEGRDGLSAAEARALSVGTATEGGNAVPTEQFFNELIKAVDDVAVLRTICRVLPPVVNAQVLGAPTLSADPADADWTTELGTGSEDSTMAFGKREMQPSPVAKRIKASDKLLRASPMMIDALVRDRLGYKVGITHAKAFNTGSGASQPLGLYTASASGISTGRDVEIGNGSGAVDADKLITARYTLRAGYEPNARWHFHRLWLAKFRKLKGSDNNYLWQPGLAGGMPSTFLDFPYSVDEYAPSTTTHGAGVYAAVLGDFGYYWIVDALGMTIKRLDELYAETNQVGFIIRAEADGMPVLEDAFVRCIAAT